MGNKEIVRKGENTDATLKEMVKTLRTLAAAIDRSRLNMQRKRIKLTKSEHTVGAWTAVRKLEKYSKRLRHDIDLTPPNT